MNQKCETIYFDKPGKENTDKTLKLAKKRAEELGIKNIVIASYTGYSAVKASEIFKNYNLIISAGMVGFREANSKRMIPENQKKIESNGGKIFYHLHSFGTLGRAIKQKFGVIQIDEIIAHVLRLFSQGVKVGCEISCMAADSGLIRTDEECIAIGGASSGADTAIVLLPANTHRFFEMKIREIICKPR